MATIDSIRVELETALLCLQIAAIESRHLEEKLSHKEEEKGEICNFNQILKDENENLSQLIKSLQDEFQVFKNQHSGCSDKIAALRSVARALESENQLIFGEKVNLERKNASIFAGNSGLRVAVDQIDSLRRQV
jgi:predicted nuclease with TOPRIM domain